LRSEATRGEEDKTERGDDDNTDFGVLPIGERREEATMEEEEEDKEEGDRRE